MKKIVCLLFASLVLLNLTLQLPMFYKIDPIIYATHRSFPEAERESEVPASDDEITVNPDEIDESGEDIEYPADSEEPGNEEVIPPTPPSTFDPHSIPPSNPSEEMESGDSSVPENNWEDTSQTSSTIETNGYQESFLENKAGKAKERSVEPGRIVSLPSSDLPERYMLVNLINFANENTALLQRYYLLQSSLVKNLVLGSNYESTFIIEPTTFETIVLNFLQESLQTIVDTL